MYLRLFRRISIVVASLLLLALAIGLSGPEGVVARLAGFSPWVLLGLLTLLLVNLLIVSLRFWRILEHFGVNLPLSVAARANISGHVAGHFMISLFGQVMGRQAVLRNHGMQPVTIAGLAAYERVVIALVSGFLCLLGTIYLVDGAAITKFMGQMSLLEIAATAGGGAALSLWLGRSQFEKRLSTRALSRTSLMQFIEALGITFLARLLMLLTYVFSIMTFKPDIGMLELFAAAAVISFAAALPITVNGWGVREIAAMTVLGQLGMPAVDAVTASIIVGLCSMLAIFLVTPFVLKPSEFNPFNSFRSNGNRSDTIPLAGEFEKSAAWLLGMAVAVAVFFQAHINLQGSVINLNLADPFAVLSIAAVVMHILFFRHWPVWRIRYFNFALCAVTLLLLVGFVRGWMEIGITQWALVRTLLGWLVILGYLSAGYLIVAYAGSHGLRRISETIVATAVVIVIFQIGLRLLDYWGLYANVSLPSSFEGYADNRNAFAFQLLTGMALLLGYSIIYARNHNATSGLKVKFVIPLLLGVILAGLYWTESRAGWGTAVILLLGVGISRLVDIRLLGKGIVLAMVICSGTWLVSHAPVGQLITGEVTINDIYTGNYTSVRKNTEQMASLRTDSSIEASDRERWATFVHAVELWKQSPVLGVGLGVFIEKSPEWIGHRQIIHNTFLWILTELGLIGAILMVSIFLILLYHSWMTYGSTPAGRILLFMLIVFAAFSMTHDIFYQRIFWVVLGAVLAQPFVYRNVT